MYSDFKRSDYKTEAAFLKARNEYMKNEIERIEGENKEREAEMKNSPCAFCQYQDGCPVFAVLQLAASQYCPLRLTQIEDQIEVQELAADSELIPDHKNCSSGELYSMLRERYGKTQSQ